jgi:hypothetical protein
MGGIGKAWKLRDPFTKRPSKEADSDRRKVIMASRSAAGVSSGEWAIVDSNHGPPPYQSGALTD